METNSSQFAALLHKIKQTLGNREVNAQNIIGLVQIAMEVVESTKVKGEAQKDLAVKLIRQVVVDAPISDDKEKLLLDMIDQNVLSDTFELVIKATKGELNVNVAIKTAQNCCFAFLKR